MSGRSGFLDHHRQRHQHYHPRSPHRPVGTVGTGWSRRGGWDGSLTVVMRASSSPGRSSLGNRAARLAVGKRGEQRREKRERLVHRQHRTRFTARACGGLPSPSPPEGGGLTCPRKGGPRRGSTAPSSSPRCRSVSGALPSPLPTPPRPGRPGGGDAGGADRVAGGAGWAAVQGADVKEHVQSAPTGGNVWGQSKLHMQASINFLQELTTKLAASAKPGGKQ